MDLVFVYGTLKPDRYFYNNVSQHVKEYIPAYTYGSLYNLGAYPVFSLEGSEKVHGYILVVNEDFIKKADSIEGFISFGSELNLYDKTSIYAYSRGEYTFSYTCWVYYMDKEKIKRLNGIHIPDGNWDNYVTF